MHNNDLRTPSEAGDTPSRRRHQTAKPRSGVSLIVHTIAANDDLRLISDIHGNLPALQAVLNDMVSNGAERVLCLGDVIGYGPQPGECLDLLVHADFLIMGNHEEAVLHGAENFNPRAKRAIDWTRDAILNQATPEIRQRREKMLNELKTAGLYSRPFLHPRQPTRSNARIRDAA